ncbi:MAG: adenylyl-sulfate kinase [Calditrichaeota bacterium]|nr:adenylyl-sulfate kinase [Calditrichota bacterium]
MMNKKENNGGGVTVWITGLPFSGKKKIAQILADRLHLLGFKAEILVGGELRRLFDEKLGFTREEVFKNVRRIAYECKLLSENGIIAIAVTISPFRDQRDECRKMIGRFVEVYNKCPLEILKKKDKKGLFKKAEEKKIKNVAGIDMPYEEPVNPELTIECKDETPADAAMKIILKLQELDYLQGADRSVLLKQEEKDIRDILRKTWFK